MSEKFSTVIPALMQSHFDHLSNSAISVEVMKVRGYKSITRITRRGKSAATDKPSELEELGFSSKQLRAPGILIPIHGVGGVISYMYRPDNPRFDEKREPPRPIKYENPKGLSIHIDCPPQCRENLKNPNIPLFITEGVKKGDALAAAGACVIDLPGGVWGFRGTNLFGGKTVLPDLDFIAWDNRLVYLLFDSDASSNPHVMKALNKLEAVLRLMGKGIQIRKLSLPPGPDGEKVGADDYLVQGHTLENVISLEEINADTYKELATLNTKDNYELKGMVPCRKTKDGGSVRMANFDCHIMEEIEEFDGRETKTFFLLAGHTEDNVELKPIEISADKFKNMDWILDNWSIYARIKPGPGNKDFFRDYIMERSANNGLKRRRVLTHTGWIQHQGMPVFLTAGGAIGPVPDINVDVRLKQGVDKFILLPPSGDPVEQIRTSYSFLALGDMKATLPLWTAMYLAPLTELIPTNFTLWILAGSGRGKSTLSALAQSHFGDFDDTSFLAEWIDTANAVNKLLFLAKDLPVIIDDYAPASNALDARKMNSTFDQVIRAQANRHGRQRMNSERALEGGYPPRGLLISSGEKIPGGYSQTARVITFPLKKGDFNLDDLTKAQDKGITRQYNAAMAYYIQWLSRNWPELSQKLPALFIEKRKEFYKEGVHLRVISNLASLYVGLFTASRFAEDMNALSRKESELLRKEGLNVFNNLISSQAEQIEGERPSERFREAVRTLILQQKILIDHISHGNQEPLVSNMRKVGWYEIIDKTTWYYFIPGAIHEEVYKYYLSQGSAFTFGEKALWEDLREEEYIKTSEEGRFTYQIKLKDDNGTTKPRVIKIRKSFFFDEEATTETEALFE